MKNFCICWTNKKIKSTENEQNDNQNEDTELYGTIDTTDSNKQIHNNVSFRNKINNDKNINRKSEPAFISSMKNSENHQDKNLSSTRKSTLIDFITRKNHKINKVPNRELPKPPKKSFNRNNIPSIDDHGNPTYESIDIENDSISDPLYSKVDDNHRNNNNNHQQQQQQKYDYPTFKNKNIKKKIIDEPLYTSASQIYSGGSEDPYSSIVSDIPGPSTLRKNKNYDDNSIYDPGYARVKEPKQNQQQKNDGSKSTDTITDIEQLYAKINRPSMKKIRIQDDNIPTTSSSISTEPGPSTSRRLITTSNINTTTATTTTPTTTSTTTVSFNQHDQTNESGSGSIISGSSANPSYRYLTVRETLDVVRERIRQRDNRQNDDNITREHYYSTIANEYESVGGGSLSDSIYGTTISSTIPVVDASTRRISPLTLNVARLSGIFENTPPRPPTSPIPNRGLPQTTINSIMSKSIGGTTTTTSTTRILSSDDRSNSNPNIPNGIRPINNPHLWQSQTAANVLRENPFPRGRPRIIPDISTNSTTFASTLSSNDDTYLSRTSIDNNTPTPTKELVNSETQTNLSSRIPLSTSRLQRQRSQSPVVNVSTQTNGISSNDQENKRSKLNISTTTLTANPLPSGRDYISPVDLSQKRAWPLENNNNNPSGNLNNPSK